MRRINILLLITSIVAIVSCTKQHYIETPIGEGYIVIQSSLQHNTKATLIEDKQVFWEPGDRIKLFYNGLEGNLVATINSPEPIAPFSGRIGFISGSHDSSQYDNTYLALYPYSTTDYYDGEWVYTSLSHIQQARTETFPSKRIIHVGKSQNTDIFFNQICGGIRFMVDRENIKIVTFKGNGGEPLAGSFRFQLDGNGIPNNIDINKTEESIILLCENGFEVGKWYYIICLPVDLKNGYSLSFCTETSKGTYCDRERHMIDRGVFGSIDTPDIKAQWENDGGKGFVEISDILKLKPNELSYTSMNDEIVKPSDPQAFGPSLISNECNASLGTMRFDSALKSVCGAFENCTSLVSIQFPESVTTVGGFDGCSSLKNVFLPSNLKNMEEHAFNNCTSLRNISIPATVTEIARNSFYGCTSLSDISLNEGLLKIHSYAFYRTAITNITLPSSLQYLSVSAFRKCNSLTTIYCKSIVPPEIPVDMYDTRLFPSSLEAIYVPEESVETYKNSPVWENYASIIKGITF